MLYLPLTKTFLGDFRRTPTWDALTPCPKLAYCCPSCGEIWARAITPHPEWMFLTRPCERCPTPWHCPGGSLLLSWNPVQLAEFPPAANRREFVLYYEHVFKRKFDEPQT